MGLGARPAFVGFGCDELDADGRGGDPAGLLLIFIFGLDPPGVETDGVVGVEGPGDAFIPPFVLRLNFSLNGPLILAVYPRSYALFSKIGYSCRKIGGSEIL